MKRSLFYSLAILFFLFPAILLGLKSVTPIWRWGEPLSFNWTLRGWTSFWMDDRILHALWLSLLIALTVTLINLAVGMMAGKALSHSSFKGKSMLETLLLLPLFVPAMAAAIGLHITMIRLGLANHWTGVVIVHLVPTIPYTIKIMKAGYDRLGSDLIDQSRMLKAGPFRTFREIELPLLLPSVRSAVFLVVTISMSQYVLTAIIGGGSVITLPIIYYPFLQSVDDTVMAAFSIVFAILPVFAVLIIELISRFFITKNSFFNRGAV
ncbi:ABC transporter permease [Jeotgalibacillus proteolyticus]|uniref:ABC transporter permease n=1 Tax=Jeotgalibacillus proteolyticus TaxID=2082395 RepID=A0A2S5GC87_9BACL|nr:ABC transporter permease subunit [Jeotgalibacillus proteolyticus]PPA70568.1 ABC transporter permease [Jeotgalibacillus proteolyticus]